MTSDKLIKKAKSLEPTVRIGKSGITKSQIKEIKKQLGKRKLIKIKMLRPFIESRDKKKAISQIAEQANAEVINAVGFTFTLHKR